MGRVLQPVDRVHLRGRRFGGAVQDRRLRVERPAGLLARRGFLRHLVSRDDLAVVDHDLHPTSCWWRRRRRESCSTAAHPYVTALAMPGAAARQTQPPRRIPGEEGIWVFVLGDMS